MRTVVGRAFGKIFRSGYKENEPLVVLQLSNLNSALTFIFAGGGSDFCVDLCDVFEDWI